MAGTTCWRQHQKADFQRDSNNQALDKRRPLLQGNPLWYSRRINLALELGEPDSVQDQLFADAIAAHPRYHSIFFGRFRHVSPQSGGSEDDVMTLLGQVAGLGAAAADEGTYARLVWVADDAAIAVQFHKHFNAPAMRAATRALVNRFPAQRNVQKMLFLACVRSDKPLATELLPLVSEPTLVDVLRGGVEIYEDCLRWTRGELKEFAIREHDAKGRVTERLVR